MRKLILSILVASTAVAATPAAAQYWRPTRAVHNQIQRDIDQLENRINRAERRNNLSPREALGLRRDALNLQRLYYRYSRNGLDRREVTDLEIRVNRLHQRLRYERRDWDGRRG
jgi:hypothetical protein